MPSKVEIEGERILKRMLKRDTDHGGIFSEVTGAQGSSKTSILLSFTKSTMLNHPNEKIFWSENYRSPLQIFKLGKGNYQFYVKEGSNVIFRDRNRKLKEVSLGEEYFRTYDELYDMAKPGQASVVFFGDRLEWMDFIEYLSGAGEWVNIYIDEMGDVCPSMTANPTWARIGRFVETAKSIRRCMMNVHCNTQSVVDVDFRVRGKIMVKVYLPGARKDKTSRITQRAIDNLQLNPIHGNEAWVEFSGKFGRVRFTDIFKPNKKYHYEAYAIPPKVIPKSLTTFS